VITITVSLEEDKMTAANYKRTEAVGVTFELASNTSPEEVKDSIKAAAEKIHQAWTFL
jgi:uncharacterized OsmC-like protein